MASKTEAAPVPVHGKTKNEALRARHTAAVPRGISTKSVYAAKAENAHIWDVEGK